MKAMPGVRDALEPIKLEITAADIACSVKADPAQCAAAQAVRRILGAEDVRIFKARAFVKVEGVWFRYMVPPAVYREITAFDRGASFEPGEYFLRPPSRGERLGSHQPWAERVQRAQSKSKKTPLIGTKTKNIRPDSDPNLADILRPKPIPENYVRHLPPHITKAANYA